MSHSFPWSSRGVEIIITPPRDADGREVSAGVLVTIDKRRGIVQFVSELPTYIEPGGLVNCTVLWDDGKLEAVNARSLHVSETRP